MSLSIGIVGLPNVGKSTLFNALTKKSVPAENYPFCTIDPSVGVVAVPDERLEKLTQFSKSKKTIPAAVEFVDIAGLVKGASTGEGLGNKFLSHIRETDAIAEVVRIFEDGNVIHVNGKVDPVSDIEVINLELVLADTESVSKKIASLGSNIKRGDKKAIEEKAVLDKVFEALSQGKLAKTVEMTPEELVIIKQSNLLTMKPIFYVLNKKVGGTNIDEVAGDERFAKLMQFMKDNNALYTIVDAGIESELREMNDGDRDTFRKELGVKDDGINNMIMTGYQILNLITFLTTGEDETRAWTIKKDSTAPEAGAAIHTDFRERFIRAEVVMWDKLLESGSYGKARELGLIRTEGKDYVVKDGDVIEFKV